MTEWTLTQWTDMPRRQTTVVELEAEWAKEQLRCKLKEQRYDLGTGIASKECECEKPGQNLWDGFKTQMQHGDELWVVRTPKDTWDEGLGLEWVLLVRAGVPVARMVTGMN
jgi:hypothetical protein